MVVQSGPPVASTSLTMDGGGMDLGTIFNAALGTATTLANAKASEGVAKEQTKALQAQIALQKLQNEQAALTSQAALAEESDFDWRIWAGVGAAALVVIWLIARK